MSFRFLFLAFLLTVTTCTNRIFDSKDVYENRLIIVRNGPNLRYNDIVLLDPEQERSEVVLARYENDGGNQWEGYARVRISPDRYQLIVEGGPGTTREWNPLWLMNNHGKLTELVSWNGHNPYWDPGAEILYYTRRRDITSAINDVYRYDLATGHEDTVLIAESDSSYETWYRLAGINPLQPSMIFLTEWYVYFDVVQGWIADDGEIVSYDITERNKYYLTNNDYNEGSFSASPDNSMIAFTRSGYDEGIYNAELHLMTMAGESIGLLAEVSGGWFQDLVWSPDGKRLAYIKTDYAYSRGDILIMDVESVSIDTLTTDAIEDTIWYTVCDWGVIKK